MLVYQAMVSGLHEIESWTQDARVIPIGNYYVCHGTWAVIPVRNSGPKILHGNSENFRGSWRFRMTADNGPDQSGPQLHY
jgi:hypothetical protein